MKKVIKSFWVTAEERNIDLVLKMTDKIMFQQKFTMSDICLAMTYQITSRRHLPSSSSMTTIRYRNNSISPMYSLHKSTTSHITNICFNAYNTNKNVYTPYSSYMSKATRLSLSNFSHSEFFILCDCPIPF